MRALQSAKVRYRAALSTLEAISEEVHLKRRMAAMLPPRTPGVGAENLSDVGSDLPSINLGRPEGLSELSLIIKKILLIIKKEKKRLIIDISALF